LNVCHIVFNQAVRAEILPPSPALHRIKIICPSNVKLCAQPKSSEATSGKKLKRNGLIANGQRQLFP
jgi:hypothetical protein